MFRCPTQACIAGNGFVPNQPAPDGDDLDAYVLGVFEPLEDFSGKCIAVVHRTDDDDDKFVLLPEGVEYTDAQIMALVEWQTWNRCRSQHQKNGVRSLRIKSGCDTVSGA